jgi:alkylhydroperoxidase/carboxymuconolactone decarboxylase family protein YurZ
LNSAATFDRTDPRRTGYRGALASSARTLGTRPGPSAIRTVSLRVELHDRIFHDIQASEDQMHPPSGGISEAFQTFLTQTPQHARAWMSAVEGLSDASALEEKTRHLAFLAVLAVLRLDSGLPFHVQLAKKAGASRDEVASAILIGLPAAGNVVTQSLPVALAAYDAG